jgi:transcriptional regulator with XRE-family HTH domain
MSQVRLAVGLGVSFQQVQKYENGTNRLSASRLQRAAEVLEIPMTFFFDDSDHKVKIASRSLPSHVREFLSASDGLALAKAFMRLKTANSRRLAVRLVQDLLKGDEV